MKNILKSNGKLLYGIIVLSVTLLSLSYGIFVITSSGYKASELMVGNLLYGITIHDTDKVLQSNPVTVEAGETTLYITISSVNSIASKYTLAYNNNNVTVSASNKSGWNASGSMTNYNNYAYSKTVKVVVSNNSGSNQSVTFAAFGGYSYNSTSNIPLGSGWYSVANFSDVTQISGEYLTDIVEEDTNCSSSTCLYGGEASTNYFSFEENGELYRIIGRYTIDNDKVTKIAANTLTEVTTSSNLSAALNTIKSSLDTDNIYSTNKFNCQGTNSLTCTSSSYTDLGILSLDEYKNLEGDSTNSYLYSSNSYYLLDNTTLVTNTNQDEEATSAKVRPAMYLEDSAEVTGSGTVDDPYVLESGEVNIIAYYLDNTDVTNTMTYSTLYNGNYEIDKVLCSKGEAIVGENNYISFTTLPANCSIYFVELTDLVEQMRRQSIGVKTNFKDSLTTYGVYMTTATQDETPVYYYSGYVTNNWLIFGKCTSADYNCNVGDYLYWRIMRSNSIAEGGGVRLIYSGSGPNGTKIEERNIGTTEPHVGGPEITATNDYNQIPNQSEYVGYSFTLGEQHGNDNDSLAKAFIDSWYNATFKNTSYENKINTSGHYCNDRTTAEISTIEETKWVAGRSVSQQFYFNPYFRTEVFYSPTLSCSDSNDVFIGEAALPTVDEFMLMGGRTSWINDRTWFGLYSDGTPINGRDSSTNISFATMSARENYSGYKQIEIYTWHRWNNFFDTHSSTGVIDNYRPGSYGKLYLSPVISLKSSVTVTGSGTSTDPYIIN